ncbi:unnamed protein product [Mytilus edulis]|uniref:B box-type domain-containing protein n=1 Tax=Mytilus edulis TaxID=6550 RepID=A0A8S3QE65_MYTED|nr:unnamed protein product [Mytilus edulis]
MFKMTSTILCGICHYEDTIKDARQWCTNCEEGLCEDCENVHRSTKNTRTHKIISIDDYQEIKDVLVSQVCEQHGKSYDLYCPTHDNAICIGCIDQHKSCSQVIPLTDAVVNIKESTALTDLEDTINGALHNSKTNIKVIKSSAEAFDKQEEKIKKHIKEVREDLNKHLDEMEQKLTKDFATKSENCKTAYANTITQIMSSDDKLKKLKKGTENLKRIALDKQIFLGTRKIGKVVEKEINSMKSIFDAEKSYEIDFELDANISSFLNNVSHLGSISIKEYNANLQFQEPNLNQAQMQVSLPLVQELQLKYKLKLQKINLKLVVTGCIMLTNGDVIIADHWTIHIVLISHESGSNHNYINIRGRPYDLTMIDPDHIAITYGSTGSNIVNVIKLSTGVTVKKIPTKQFAKKDSVTQSCFGISYWDGKLYVMVEMIGIVVLDTSGKALNTLSIDTEKGRKIVVFKDRIYYTNRKKNTVHCLNLAGQEMWVYRDKSIVEPCGLAVASNLDVFVSCSKSNNVILIKCDGKR